MGTFGLESNSHLRTFDGDGQLLDDLTLLAVGRSN